MINFRDRHGLCFLRFFLLLAALTLCACNQSREAADTPRMDRLDLLADADLIVRASDTSGLVAAVEQSPLGRFWNSPEMAGFRNGKSIEEEIRLALVDADEGENAARIRDIYLEEMRMFTGEFILGLKFSDFENQPELAIAAAMRAEDYQRSLEMDELLFELEEVETIKASEDFRGTPIYTYMRKEKDGDRFFYQAFYAGTLLASDDRAWLERALVQLKETPAREPEGEPAFSINGKAHLIDRLQSHLAAQASQAEAPFDIQAIVKSLGIDTLGDMGLNLRLQEDRLEMDFLVARRGEWNRGLMVLIPPEPAPLDFRLAHVPRDVASYQVTRLDLNAFWKQIPEMLQQISPELQMQFSMGVGAVGGMMNIDVNEDIFSNLDRLAYTYTRFGDQGQELLYGLKVKDADAMERTLRKLFAAHSPVVAQLGDLYHETDVQGHVIHSLQFPMPAAEDDVPAFNEIGLTVVDRALVVGQSGLLEDYVQAAVHNQGVPEFYESPPFKAMVARVPAEACSYGWSDLAAYAHFFIDEVQEAAAQLQAAGATPASADQEGGETVDPLKDLFGGFAVDRLPPAEVIADYIGASDGYSVIDAAGFRSTWTIHYPEN